VTREASHVTAWAAGEKHISLDRPIVVAIINVTPDSFSDGGAFATLESAVQRVDDSIGEGADVIDIGGESTRPGAARISEEEELRRVIPVIRQIRRQHPGVPLSIDTTRAAVARAALSGGADIVNDVSGLRLDPALADVVAAAGAGLILVHSRGRMEEMASYEHAVYRSDVAAEVVTEIGQALDRAFRAGISRDALVVDPGIGFSKRAEHSLAVLRDLDRLIALGFPVMVGASRKRVIGEVTGAGTPGARKDGTLGAHVAALAKGARLFRVHDVRAHRQALDVAWRILG
jgi:dihydropteroate synthase